MRKKTPDRLVAVGSGGHDRQAVVGAGGHMMSTEPMPEGQQALNLANPGQAKDCHAHRQHARSKDDAFQVG